jgi:hypothetical protein
VRRAARTRSGEAAILHRLDDQQVVSVARLRNYPQ